MKNEQQENCKISLHNVNRKLTAQPLQKPQKRNRTISLTEHQSGSPSPTEEQPITKPLSETDTFQKVLHYFTS